MKKDAIGFIWILMSIILQTAAQVFGKQAALVSYGNGMKAMVMNIWYLLELISLFCQALCWAMALRNFPLSFAYPFMSLVIGLNLFASWFFFNETVTFNNIVGIAAIMTGVILINSKVKS
jgi:multidrug transporter EmrE-like cation transporter